MISISAYKATKAFLNGFPVFWDNGQLKGGKTLYKSKSVLIEPKKTNGKIKHFGKIMADRDYAVKVTAVSPAPWTDHDNSVQDNLLKEHENYAADVLLKLVDQEIKDEHGRLVLTALTLASFAGPLFNEGNAYTEMTFVCEAYDYTQVPVMIKITPEVEITPENG